MTQRRRALGGIVLGGVALDGHYGGVTSSALLAVHDSIVCPLQDVVQSLWPASFSMVDAAVFGLAGAALYQLRKKTIKSAERSSRAGTALLLAGGLACGWVTMHTINNHRPGEFDDLPGFLNENYDGSVGAIERHKDNVDAMRDACAAFAAGPVTTQDIAAVHGAAQEVFDERAAGVNVPPLRTSILTWPSRGAFYNIVAGEAVMRPFVDPYDRTYLGTYAHEMAHRISANECNTQLIGWEVMHRALARRPSMSMLQSVLQAYRSTQSNVEVGHTVSVTHDFTDLWSHNGLTYGHALLASAAREQRLGLRIVQRRQAFSLDDVVFVDALNPRVRVDSEGADVRVVVLRQQGRVRSLWINDELSASAAVEYDQPATVHAYSLFGNPVERDVRVARRLFVDAQGEFAGTETDFRSRFSVSDAGLTRAFLQVGALGNRVRERESWLRRSGESDARFIGLTHASGLVACYEVASRSRVVGFEVGDAEFSRQDLCRSIQAAYPKAVLTVIPNLIYVQNGPMQLIIPCNAQEELMSSLITSR